MDWIDTFFEWTEGIPSPEIFRLWCGISAVAGALERRVWIQTSGGILYPNLFVLLVAPPAIGKSQALNKTREMWKASKKVKLAPNSVTKAGLLDHLVKCGEAITVGSELLQHSSLSVCASEFGTLVPAHDTEFLSVLIDLYDTPDSFIEERRDRTRCVEIINPSLNLIAGTQPGFLANLLPEEAWSMGYMSRNIMIYSGSGPTIDLFDLSKNDSPQRKPLIAGIKKMCELTAHCTFSQDYIDGMREWQQQGLGPVPTHSKLQHYNGRRLLFALKLSLVSAVSRSLSTKIESIDLERAKRWLFQAEQYMPDVFRDMVNKSDTQIIADLHHYLWRYWVQNGKKPVHEVKLYNFLQARTISERIPRIIEVAVRSAVLSKTDLAGTAHYTPRPHTDHGME